MELKRNRISQMEEREGMHTEGSGSRQQGHELLEKENMPKLPGTTTAESQIYMKGSARENLHQILCKVTMR